MAGRRTVFAHQLTSAPHARSIFTNRPVGRGRIRLEANHPEANADNVLRKTQPGSIILLHDGDTLESTAVRYRCGVALNN